MNSRRLKSGKYVIRNTIDTTPYTLAIGQPTGLPLLACIESWLVADPLVRLPGLRGIL